MKKGLIMEIENNKAVVMLTGGDFVSVAAKPGWRQGDVVSVETKRFPLKVLYTAAACFILVFFISISGIRMYNNEISIISMDINPSIEMGINRFDRVIRVTGYNDESLALLESVKLTHKAYTDAIGDFLTSESLTPFLTEDVVLVKVTVHSSVPEKSNVLSHVVNSEIESISAHQAVFVPDCEIVTHELVNHAHEHGMTSGKYSEILGIKELVPEIDIEDYRDMSIGELRTIKGHHHETITGANAEPPVMTDHDHKAPVNETTPNQTPTPPAAPHNSDKAHPQEEAHDLAEPHNPVEIHEPVETHEPIETHEPVETHEPAELHDRNELQNHNELNYNNDVDNEDPKDERDRPDPHKYNNRNEHHNKPAPQKETPVKHEEPHKRAPHRQMH